MLEEVFEKKELLLLETTLIRCIINHLLLLELVLRRNGLTESGDRIFILESISRVDLFCSRSIEADDTQVTVSIRSGAYLFKEAVKYEKCQPFRLLQNLPWLVLIVS